MNTDRLNMMVEMLKEVEAGTWTPTDESSIPINLSEIIEEGGVSFNMHTWGAIYDEDADDEIDEEQAKGAISCGYSACAVGHAMLDSRFEDLVNLDFSNPNPQCDYDCSWGAVRKYFEITDDQAVFLFDNGSYEEGGPENVDWADSAERSDPVTATMVRERIEAFIKSGGDIDAEEEA